jgi:Na+/melibiose symporter-like transporter
VIDLAGIQRSATIETVDPESLTTLALAMGPGVMIMIGSTIIAASFYDLSREKHRLIREEIADVNAAS